MTSRSAAREVRSVSIRPVRIADGWVMGSVIGGWYPLSVAGGVVRCLHV